MAAQDVVFSQSARRRIGHGLDVLATTVKVTLTAKTFEVSGW